MMKMSGFLLLVSFTLVQMTVYGADVQAPAASTAAVGATLKVSDGTVDFYATGKPSMLKIHGGSKALSGQFTHQGAELTGDLQVPLDGFTTGMGVRDTHLKEKIFESSKYDKSTLKITKLTLPDSKPGTYKEVDFKGKLNFHGTEKDVSGKADVTLSDANFQFDATLEVNLTDFNIPPPEFMGMTIQDKVKIEAKGEAK